MDCPSYTLGCKVKNMPGNVYKLMGDLNDVEHFEALYCAFEKSRCIEEDRGCLCEQCPVHAQYHLNREPEQYGKRYDKKMQETDEQ